jgi:chromosomal replication initiator protein
MYVTSETFTNDVINAIRTQRMDDFRGRYRSIDILMVDDIQFIAGKESTQEEFFHTFNALYQNGKQVIVSSDKPPRSIAQLEERMRSRFAGGLIADVQSPDFEMRIAILRSKADELGINLPHDVIEYIAHRDQTNIRELEGALNKILMMAQLYNRPLSLSLAMEALTDASISQRRASTTSSDVIDAVSRHFQVSEKDLLGRQRTREIVFPRQIAMYLMREETDISLEEIGRAMGGRDHTTVLHGVKKIEAALDEDVQLRASLMAIREVLLTESR